jgi:glycosyltransferase involved in cell wall biosynthesis
VQPEVAAVRAPVSFLDARPRRRLGAQLRLAWRHPGRYLATLCYAVTRKDLYGGYTKLNPLQAFSSAARIAAQLSVEPGDPVTHIHAHFAHDPALVALLVSRLTGIPFSFTAHARDLYQIPQAALLRRARAATAVVACCRTNADYTRRVAGGATAVELVYHGVDLNRFTPSNGDSGNGAARLVSVGRLVEKKGFDDLLAACAVVAQSGRSFHCDIYGDGPERARLEAARDRLGLQSVVRFCGARTQAELRSVYRNADLFVLTPKETADGDRDGVPNVLLEAMACGKPVVATSAGGVAELVQDRFNGILVGGRDSREIAKGIAALLDDAATRRRYGENAARTVRDFDSHRAAERLASIFAREVRA